MLKIKTVKKRKICSGTTWSIFESTTIRTVAIFFSVWLIKVWYWTTSLVNEGKKIYSKYEWWLWKEIILEKYIFLYSDQNETDWGHSSLKSLI